MQFMMIVKATKKGRRASCRGGEDPHEMQKYNEELVKAGVLAANGPHSSAKGALVTFTATRRASWMSLHRDEGAHLRYSG